LNYSFWFSRSSCSSRRCTTAKECKTNIRNRYIWI